MKIFKYKAIDKNGVTVKGELTANSTAHAIKVLSTRELQTFSLTQKRATNSSFKLSRVKAEETARYIKQLAILLGAGVNLIDSMESLSKSTSNPKFTLASQRIKSDLRAGIRLSESISENIPKIPHYVPKLLELAELTGQSGKALHDAAEQMEYDLQIRNELKSALTYPIFLAFAGSAIILLMFIFVIPRFENLLTDNSTALPLVSRIVLGSGIWVSDHIAIFLGTILSIIFFIATLLANKRVKRHIVSILESSPVIGLVLMKSEIGKWSKTIGTALDNGANLVQSLGVAQSGIRAKKLGTAFEATARQVRAGKHIEDALKDNIQFIDPLHVDLIRTGRTTGNLAEIFIFIGNSQATLNRDKLKSLSNIIEPIAILCISAIIGTIVIGLVLAMTSIYQVQI